MPQSHVVTSSSEAVTLISTASGAQEWQYGPINASSRCVVVKGTAVVKNHVYAGAYDGWIHKIAFATGAPLAKFEVGGPVRGLTYADDVLYANVGNSLQAHDPVTGPLWTHRMGDLAWGDPVWSNGIVYAGSWDRKLYAIEANGTPAWISTAFEFFASEPAVADGVVYASGYDTDSHEPCLAALDAASGEVLWQAQAPNKETIVDPVAVGDGRVYAPTGWGALMCAFDAATGAAQWSLSTKPHPATPLFSDGRIYVASQHSVSGGRLQAYDSDTGALLWTSQALIGSAGQSVSRPTVDEGDVTNYVLVTSQDGYLQAFDRDTGELAWKAAIGDGGWPNDPTWTDAAGPPIRPGRLREYRAVDPLALILPGPVYVDLNLPYPPPVEAIVARLRKSASPRRREEVESALSELRRIGSYVASLQKAIQGEVGRGPGGIQQ
ncbi:MAG TPA: PQQ-binding-like beta-propeller repeat protein [Actinomycetota bacterium]|nr:PQQ-binding-like beta-propeller repeat protein [Actinomycetota bacterium]